MKLFKYRSHIAVILATTFTVGANAGGIEQGKVKAAACVTNSGDAIPGDAIPGTVYLLIIFNKQVYVQASSVLMVYHICLLVFSQSHRSQVDDQFVYAGQPNHYSLYHHPLNTVANCRFDQA